MEKYKVILGVSIIILSIILNKYRDNLMQIINSTLLYNKPTDLYTSKELKNFDGINNAKLYLAILGQVFDVTKSKKHYGRGETYNVFVGRDASRSFVTGEFSDNKASDDVTGFNNEEFLSLNNWLNFYKKEYDKVGKVIGRFYDGRGNPTQALVEIENLIKIAQNENKNDEFERLKFPPCNVEWTPEFGSRVWCTKRSGGIERDWIGVPRILYEPGSNAYRCACVSEENINLGNLRVYEDCDPTYVSCFIKTTS